ncbi:MAG: hypothetical protein WAU69_01215 [Solirubrobacteraceae bacterium]
MYQYECDWCGRRINPFREQYVEASIEIVTGEKDYAGRAQNRVEPSRFFHVTPLRSREEWDRLGLELEVGSEEIGDCCYTRALRHIEPADLSEPDMGLEWRLVPVGARISEDGEVEQSDAGPFDHEPLWQRVERRGCGEPYLLPRDDPRAFRWLGDSLCGGSMPGASAYTVWGIETVGDLRAAIENGRLLKVQGVGPKRMLKIQKAFERFLKTVEDKPVSAGNRRKARA